MQLDQSSVTEHNREVQLGVCGCVRATACDQCEVQNAVLIKAC